MGVGATAGTLALIALIAFPVVAAEHCESGIAVFGRSALGPGIVPPAAAPLGRNCVAVESTISAGHLLPPASDQVFVRVEVDLGASYTKLLLRLDGLGFRDQGFHLDRVTDPLGTSTYQLDDWLTLPDAPNAQGVLRASVKFPGNHVEVAEYTLIALPAPPTKIGQP